MLKFRKIKDVAEIVEEVKVAVVTIEEVIKDVRILEAADLEIETNAEIKIVHHDLDVLISILNPAIRVHPDLDAVDDNN